MAQYILALREKHGEYGPTAEGALRLSESMAGKDCPELRQRTFAFLFGRDAKGLGTALLTHEWHHPFDEGLTREEARQSPLLPVVLAIAEFIAAHHPKVRSFLRSGN